MTTLKINNGKASLTNNQNTHNWWINKYDLSDFNWYVNKKDGKKYLATFLTDRNARSVAERSQLFNTNEHGTIFPNIKGFLMGNIDRWFVIKVDQRNMKRLISADLLNQHLFNLLYKPINKNNQN